MFLRSKKAFTLLEVLIAVLLFTAGVVVTAGLFSAALVSSVDSEKTGIAANLAQKRMEEIRNLDFDGGIVEYPRADVSGFLGFEDEVAVTSPDTDIKEVTVTVYWKSKASDVTTAITTYFSKN